MNKGEHGRPLSVDQTAQSSSPTEPAFVARPEGAPVYHGFVILDDVVVDGFTLGKITDWEAEPCETGDAFVIAPDGSRAGLVWEVCDPPYFQEVMPIETTRGRCRDLLGKLPSQLVPEGLLPIHARWRNPFSSPIVRPITRAAINV